MSDLIPLKEVLLDLPGMRTRDLMRLEREGQFPPVMIVTARRRYVRRVDYDRWKRGRWTNEMRRSRSGLTESARAKLYP